MLNPRLRCLALMLGVLLAACAPSGHAGEPSPLPAQAFIVGAQPSIHVEANAGLLHLVSGREGVVELSGVARFPQHTELHASQSGDAVSIALDLRGPARRSAVLPPAELEISLPPGAALRVETFVADVELHDLQGMVEVVSTAGDIAAYGLEGSARLRSARGDVSAAGGSGEIRLLGEHGVLSLDGVSGSVSATTIMGTIRYTGSPGEGDAVRLETDHGPVEVRLGAAASLDIEAASNSGRVACPLAGFSQAATSCVGRLGDGLGSLWVRTVSGSVTIRPVP